METVFDPANLFISEIDWLNQEQQDDFLEHLLNNLTYINDYDLTLIYWTDELEVFLWDHPQLPPWRHDRDWQLKIVPIIYKLFSDRIVYLDNITGTGPCKVQPELVCSYNRPEILDCFLRLVHFLIEEENLFFCVGLSNRLSDGEKYTFYCDVHPHQLEPITINAPKDWLYYLNLLEDYWPQNCSPTEIAKFRTAVKITTETHFSTNENGILYSFHFREGFIKSLVKETACRQEILFSITKRLLCNQMEASSDNGLKDEPLKGQQTGRELTRRFRVTGENRIHYIYPRRNEILFLEYYGAGQHDKGL